MLYASCTCSSFKRLILIKFIIVVVVLKYGELLVGEGGNEISILLPQEERAIH